MASFDRSVEIQPLLNNEIRILRSRSQVFEFDEANEFAYWLIRNLVFYCLPPYPNRPMLGLTKIEPPNPRRAAAWFNRPMDLTPMPSALLVFRLRSRLWCQKQAAIPDRGHSAKT